MLPSTCYCPNASNPMLPSQCYQPNATIPMLPSQCYCHHTTICMLLFACYRPHGRVCMLPSTCYHLKTTVYMSPFACHHLHTTAGMLPPCSVLMLPPPPYCPDTIFPMLLSPCYCLPPPCYHHIATTHLLLFHSNSPKNAAITMHHIKNCAVYLLISSSRICY